MILKKQQNFYIFYHKSETTEKKKKKRRPKLIDMRVFDIRQKAEYSASIEQLLSGGSLLGLQYFSKEENHRAAAAFFTFDQNLIDLTSQIAGAESL